MGKGKVLVVFIGSSYKIFDNLICLCYNIIINLRIFFMPVYPNWQQEKVSETFGLVPCGFESRNRYKEYFKCLN